MCWWFILLTYLIVHDQGCISREDYDDLQTRFDTAEKALADKQKKIDEMKMEIFQKEKELETISVFQAQVQTIVWLAGHPPTFLSSLQLASFIIMCFCVHIQAEIYSSDFYAERAAREKIHEEKERLATQLEYVKKQHTHLQEEMESLGRYVINFKHLPAHMWPLWFEKGNFLCYTTGIPWVRCKGDMCHVGPIHKGQHLHITHKEVKVLTIKSPCCELLCYCTCNCISLLQRSLYSTGDWQQQNIPEHACPKCGEVLPDLDSLQIHIMDCIIWACCQLTIPDPPYMWTSGLIALPSSSLKHNASITQLYKPCIQTILYIISVDIFRLIDAIGRGWESGFNV